MAEGFRWMPKRATVRMRASQTGARTLRISGYCPAAALQKGALHMIVAVNGAANPAVFIKKANAPFEFGLRPGLSGELEVALEVDRTFRAPPDERELGLAFGVFELR